MAGYFLKDEFVNLRFRFIHCMSIFQYGIHEPTASVSLESKEIEDSRKPLKNNKNHLSKMIE